MKSSDLAGLGVRETLMHATRPRCLRSAARHGADNGYTAGSGFRVSPAGPPWVAPSPSSRPLAQRFVQAARNPARDRLLYGSEDVGWETRGLCDRALQVDPVARR